MNDPFGDSPIDEDVSYDTPASETTLAEPAPPSLDDYDKLLYSQQEVLTQQIEECKRRIATARARRGELEVTLREVTRRINAMKPRTHKKKAEA